MTDSSKKLELVRTLEEGNTSFPNLGYLVWWNIRNVELTRDQLIQKLEDCGLDEKYAKEHNYRSAFTRAIKNMTEKRIIRKVKEDDSVYVCQFTAENMVDSGEDEHLEYDQEAIVRVDKVQYRETGSFQLSLDCADESIKEALIAHFEREKVSYGSSDITRYLQKIFKDQADIISLREQGSVYFVPAAFEDILLKVQNLVMALNGPSKLEHIPMPDVSSSREMIKNAFTEEIDKIYESLDADVQAVLDGKEVSSRWIDNKLLKIEKFKNRISVYADVLADAGGLTTRFASLEESIMGVRDIDLGDDDESDEGSDEAPEAVEPDEVLVVVDEPAAVPAE